MRIRLVKTAAGSTPSWMLPAFGLRRTLTRVRPLWRNIVELEGVVIDVVASLAKNPHEDEAPLA